MKNKKGVFLLMPLVIGVWGILIYRIVTRNDDSLDKPIITDGIFNKKTPNEKISFTISSYDRDPFLAKTNQPVPGVSAISEAPKMDAKKLPPQTSMNWPNIKYLGTIQNPKEKKVLALLTVNNESFCIRPGEMAAGVILNKIFNDSILVFFNKEKKIIKK